jgi:hypothetical protein
LTQIIGWNTQWNMISYCKNASSIGSLLECALLYILNSLLRYRWCTSLLTINQPRWSRFHFLNCTSIYSNAFHIFKLACSVLEIYHFSELGLALYIICTQIRYAKVSVIYIMLTVAKSAF